MFLFAWKWMGRERKGPVEAEPSSAISRNPFHRTGFDFYRGICFLPVCFTAVFLQDFSIGQIWQSGRCGVQTVWPCETRIGFHVFQYLRGSTFLRAFSVCSGVFVLTSPSLLLILWTWISTHIASLSNTSASIRLATFRPTPGREQRSSNVSGTCPSNRFSASGSCFRCFAFVR